MTTLTAQIFGAPESRPHEPTEASLAEVLVAVESYLRRYVAMASDQAVATVLWVAHTHALAYADCTPYLSVRSATKRAGKTRLLEVLEPVVRAPWFTGRTTAAALVRKVDATRCTLLLDESDAAFGGEPEYTEALRGLLNSGYRSSGKATVCTAGGADVVDFATYCAKAIAGIGRLPDTVADRSIPIVLRRRRRDEPVSRWRERVGAAEAKPLHNALAAWAATATSLREARPALPDDLGDRAQDVWEPLLAIAELAGDTWPERARRAAVALMGDSQVDDTVAVQLLADIRDIFADRGEPEVLASAAIRDALIANDERPWAVWGRAGKPITPHAIARRLADFEVHGGVVKLAGKATRAYRRAAFDDAFARYLPAPGSSESLPRNPDSKHEDKEGKKERNDAEAVTAPKTPEAPVVTEPGYEVTDSKPELGGDSDDGVF